MKKNFIILIAFLSFQTQAFTKDEWINFIVDSVNTKEDLTWDYDTEKLKTYSKLATNEDSLILKDLSSEEDLQISQASKYLLSRKGEQTNDFIIDNYLESSDIKNSLYYLNLNFINTPNKDNFWQILKSKEHISKEIVLESFSTCDNFKDVNEMGGKVFDFKDYDSFFEQRLLLENYTKLDLMYLELDISDREYPLSITLFSNKYIINSDEDEVCLKTSDNIDYIYLQKISAIYKQYQREDLLKDLCLNFEDNQLLKNKFNYLCSNSIIKK